MQKDVPVKSRCADARGAALDSNSHGASLATREAMVASSPPARCPSPRTTPWRSAAVRFWLIFNFPSSLRIVSLNPTIP